MKKIIFLLVAMTSLSFANAQKVSNKEVPAIVKSTLQKNYPHAKEVKWSKEDGNYEAEFENGKAESGYSVVINNSGEILETEIEIKIDELPSKARDYAAKKYAGQKLKEAAKITDNKGVITYEAEVKEGDLVFDKNGNFIKIERE